MVLYQRQVKRVLGGIVAYSLVVSVAVGVGSGLLPSAIAGFTETQTEPHAEHSQFRRLLPLTSFYSTPDPLPPGRPGDLIRSEEFDEYQIPEGISASRILYHSRSAEGDDIAASAVVLVPDAPPPAGGWPVIAWAHSFTGTARRCAPSLMRNLNQGPFLSMYVKLGYAIVATDYAGLGTNFRNAWVDVPSNAADVIYSIAASRVAVRQLGRKWIAMGESQGGLAALGVAELERDLRDPDYLGSIAVSGIADAQDIYEQIAKGGSPGKLVFLGYGVQTIYPRFRLNQMLTEKALALYRQIENTCGVALIGPEVPASQMLKPGWADNIYVQQFFARNAVGRKATQGPLLIISSDADPAVRAGQTAHALARMCEERDVVQFRQYQNSDSASVLGDSVRDQLSWIQARFAGRPASGNCP